MDFTGLVGDFLSPESTVTSLLSSSGHLRSSLLAPEHNTTFRYRDKNYDSASAALNAYISDFEHTRQNSKSLTGRLVLPQSPPSTPSRPRVSIIRNKDVLREHLTDKELDFLNLPVSSLHHSGNRDRLSMTTDELLSIPYDGSMPVTHTSAFIQGLLSHPGSSQPHPSSFKSAHRAGDRLSSSHAAPHMIQQCPHPARTPSSPRCRGRPGMAMLKSEDGISSDSCYRSAHRAARSERAEPSSLLHLPHWFTSNKTDMDCSGISSVPDLKYPAWIQCCDHSEAPPLTDSELCDDHAPRPRALSWVAELEDEDPDQSPELVDNQQTLRDLRLQFAQHISLLAAEKQSSDIMETLFRDNRIESLIQKADQVLNSLSHSSGGSHSSEHPDETKTQHETQATPPPCIKEVISQPDSEKQLLSSSSHCHPVNQESAPAAGGATEALTDRGAQARSCSFGGNSILKQPGPVEALKQMLFRLQAVEAELQRQQQASVGSTLNTRLQTQETPGKQTPEPEPEAELQSFPVEPSLQRALHHLSRLKVLVEEPREKHTEEEEEKDEDEGRFSSSSPDGLICTQIKPS